MTQPTDATDPASSPRANPFAPPAPVTVPPRRKLASRVKAGAFDIETWDPRRLTYRNWFITLVILLNIPLLAYDIYQSIGFWSGIGVGGRTIIAGLVLLEALMIVSLVFVWLLWKWAAISYMVLLVLMSLAMMALGMFPFQKCFHLFIFVLAVRSLWKPAFIPQHIKDKFGLA